MPKAEIPAYDGDAFATAYAARSIAAELEDDNTHIVAKLVIDGTQKMLFANGLSHEEISDILIKAEAERGIALLGLELPHD